MDAAWHPDPFHRHELRYWDGATWTDHVSDRGVVGHDSVAAILGAGAGAGATTGGSLGTSPFERPVDDDATRYAAPTATAPQETPQEVRGDVVPDVADQGDAPLLTATEEEVARARSLLFDGERLQAVIGTELRAVVTTDRRVLLLERAGGYSAIRSGAIECVEVDSDTKGGFFVKLHFGGVSRTVGIGDDREVAALLRVMEG